MIVKLTPNATEPAAVAAAAEGAGADAVSLLNTLKGMALDPHTRLPWLGGGTGGLSGPAVRAVALEQVAAVSARVGIPVVGMGGIATAADAADFLTAGAGWWQLAPRPSAIPPLVPASGTGLPELQVQRGLATA